MTERATQSMLRKTLIGGALPWLAICASVLSANIAQAQMKISEDPHGYPRLRALANGEILASGTSLAKKRISIFSSTDQGVSFTKAGQITDPEFANGLCCGTIFQTSQAIGSLASGTLLWAGSVGQNAKNRRMKIKVYKSRDNGRSWTYLSAITAANAGGLWEPDFFMANDGALVMAYSDETMSGTYSQRLMKTRTYNGTKWVDASDIVASTVKSDRPGMAFVSRMPNGSRFMTYEICGPARCTVFYRTSVDGWNWGVASNVGIAIRLPNGQYFAHAPTNQVLASGKLIVIGQMLMNANNTVASANGTIIFKSTTGSPAGPWTKITAPVPVPGAVNAPCANYSSALLPVSKGTRLLEVAGRREESCHLYFGRGPIN
jgi:hypothetical protein